MGKFWKFFTRGVAEIVFVGVIFVFASVFLGLGIASIKMFIPGILSTDSTLGIIGYAFLLGSPFIICYKILYHLNRAMNRLEEETEYEDEEEEVVETRAERRIRKLCEKLEKEGVFVIW